ncbi:MAG: PhzF family phenazine biosynthesis isomerase [Planctomycetales bacterium]|nr:PhzF family phenazine biosynthesis isomerase [Planctomycetales bacterium]
MRLKHSKGESVSGGNLFRLTAFSTDPNGGNPAGVWIGETLPTDVEMQRIAAEVGYSETAFVAPCHGRERIVRYFSPESEVPFCGHATIAASVAIGNMVGDCPLSFQTSVGEVPVKVVSRDGMREAAMTSVNPCFEFASPELVAATLSTLGWKTSDLDPAIPPARAFAGNWHLVIAVSQLERLANLSYDFERLKALMLHESLTTLQLVWREDALIFRSRNPFPVGGVVEDPATGAAAAALGGYLRDANLMSTPANILIKQGNNIGRPSRLTVEIPVSGGVIVKGTAVEILVE